MGMEFLRHNRLINRSKVDALDVLQYRIDIQTIKQICEQSHIVQIQFDESLLFRLQQGKLGIANGKHFQRHSRVGKIFELISIIIEMFSCLVLNLLIDDSFLTVFQVTGNQIVDTSDFQFMFFVIL